MGGLKLTGFKEMDLVLRQLPTATAKRVADRSRGNPEVDPNLDLPQFAAFVGVLRGDTTAALADLKIYLSKNDDRRKAIAAFPGWWYRPIEQTAGFIRGKSGVE